MVLTTAGFAALAIAAGAAAGYKQQQAAQTQRKAERKNARLQMAAEAFKNAQATKAAVAQARVRAAQALAIGEAQGVGGSSAVSGAAGSLFSGVAGEIGVAQSSQAAAYGITNNNYNASKQIGGYLTSAGLFQSASQVFSAAAGSGMFSGASTPSTPLRYNQPPSMGARNPAGQSFSFSGYSNSWANQDMYAAARRGF